MIILTDVYSLVEDKLMRGHQNGESHNLCWQTFPVRVPTDNKSAAVLAVFVRTRVITVP